MRQLEENILKILERENTNSEVKYILENDVSKALDIAFFYDQNWLGNKDFMHIPNVEDVVENIKNNYVILAKKDNRIIGSSTIKYYDEGQDYYPTDNSFFNLTGLLTERNKNNRVKGIGVNLYKICMEAIQNTYNNPNIIAEVDCRNINSLRAFYKASRNNNCHSYITGMYTCYENNMLSEAPTFIVRSSKYKPNRLSCIREILDCSDEKYHSYTEILKEIIGTISFKKRCYKNNETDYYFGIDNIELGELLNNKLLMYVPNNKNRKPKMKRKENRGVNYYE